MIQQVFFCYPRCKVASFTSDKIRQPWPEQWACDVSLIPRHWRNKHLTTDEANVNLSCTLTIWHDYVFKKGTRAHKHGSDPETLKETHRKPSNILLVLSQVPPNGACHLTATWVHSSVHGTTHWPVTPPWPFAWRTAGSAGTIPSATSSTWAKVAVEKGRVLWFSIHIRPTLPCFTCLISAMLDWNSEARGEDSGWKSCFSDVEEEGQGPPLRRLLLGRFNMIEWRVESIPLKKSCCGILRSRVQHWLLSLELCWGSAGVKNWGGKALIGLPRLRPIEYARPRVASWWGS